MEYSIYEVDWDKNILTTLEGKKFKINPYDMSVLAGWTSTTPIKEVNIDGIKYVENLSNGGRARLI